MHIYTEPMGLRGDKIQMVNKITCDMQCLHQYIIIASEIIAYDMHIIVL